MRSYSVTWLFALSTFALTGCAVDASSYEDSDAEVGVASEALSGQYGSRFWLPARGELFTNIYYCFNDISIVPPAMQDKIYQEANRWGGAANVRFFGEGSCSTAPHSAFGIHIADTLASEMFQPNSKFGTEASAFSNNPGMYLPLDPKGLGFATCGALGSGTPPIPADDCFRQVVVHEFGHALGFAHESSRSDYVDCRPGGTRAPLGQFPDTAITPYDKNSIMDVGYCRDVKGGRALSDQDSLGAGAIYGTHVVGGPCANTGCLFARYDWHDTKNRYAIRFQSSGRWLKPNDHGGTESQTNIGSWERVRFRRVSGGINDGFVRYGDTIAVVDAWGWFLSGRDTKDVDMRKDLGPWEKWVVESPDTTIAPIGSKVPINWPLRLYNPVFEKRLVESSTGDVFINAATGSSHLRINGPLIPQPVGRHYP